jgi:hypothetical protein
MKLQEAFDVVNKLDLNGLQYDKVINLICDYGNAVRTKAYKDAVDIFKENHKN